MRKNLCKHSGFTLIELMIAIGIISILTAISVPSVMNWLPNYRLKAAARNLYSNMQKAKTEAIKQNCNATITFNLPVGGINYDCVSYIDSDNDLEYDAVEPILHRLNFADYKNVTLTGNTFGNNDNGRPSIAFNTRGLPISNTGGFGAGSLTLTNTNNRIYTVTVSSAGSIKIN